MLIRREIERRRFRHPRYHRAAFARPDAPGRETVEAWLVDELRASPAWLRAGYGLERVFGGGGGEGASGRGFPLEDAWFWLSQLPALGLLAPVVVAT
jgi:hypothetical protein